jgi:hypothetical protein
MGYTEVSLVYLLTHLGRRILDFFRHWYIDGFFKAMHWLLNFFERLDRIFALRITLKNLFQPLYRDYTLIGYLWGFVFRIIRIIVGLVVYLFVLLASLALFLIWTTIPIYVIYQIIINLMN